MALKDKNNMTSICGADCENCGFGKNKGCRGCHVANGCPFGKKCFVADYIKLGGMDAYSRFVNQLISEINAFDIPGMPKINELFPINGQFVNLIYTFPNGKKEKILDDGGIYLANRVECEYNDGTFARFFGVAADTDFIAVSEYGPNGADPELILYKKR